MNSRNNNFDHIRLILAGIVFLVHIYDLTGSKKFEIFDYLSSDFAVKSFFVLSGYFILASYHSSNSLTIYLKKRFRRIYPVYFFSIIFFSVFLYLFSNSQDNYFNFSYLKYVFWNLLFLNYLSPLLPGVFLGHPFEAVNGALWTLKIEVAFYIFIPIYCFLEKNINKYILLLSFYIISELYVLYFLGFNYESSSPHNLVMAHQFPGQLRYFIVGMFWYYFDLKLNSNKVFLLISLIFIILFVISKKYFEPLIYFLPMYFFGKFLTFPNIKFNGDFSYGIYVLHYPIIQIFYSKLIEQEAYIFFGILCVILVLFSMFCWRFIEKPFLFNGSFYNNATK